jgi:polyribonucleotide nucleotidyltransferase
MTKKEKKVFKLNIGGKELKVETRNLAEQANGNILVQYGETMVLATACISDKEREGIDFFPLTVEYEEKFYAAGKILGSRYMRRESRPADEAILTSRFIDRAIRPRFPKHIKREVQVVVTCLSWDKENDPDIIGLIAASLALSISDIPWSGPLAALRVGKISDDFTLNPTYKERIESDLDLTMAGIISENETLINMIEMEGNEVAEDNVLKAMDFAWPEIKKLIDFQKEIAKEIGKEKIKIEEKAKELDPEEEKLRQEEIGEEKLVRENIINLGKRIDGRGIKEIRALSCETGLLPRTHGSGIFTRGQTRALSILTLGTPGDVRLLEGMENIGKKRFMHHYNFPPYSTGETKPMRGPGRREIGHGMLAEKALLPMIPGFDEFPYTIRVVTEILSSNGSTSMAATSSSSLALMDAGVPIKRPATGIALGLITKTDLSPVKAFAEEANYKILTDIQGPEDHYGDMDFKIAGTEKGITAIQMDVKIEGINKKIIGETLEQGKEARLQILNEITKTISEPRIELSAHAPRILILQINPAKIREVIGPGGKVINEITEDYGVSIDIEDSGRIFITAEKEESARKAVERIKSITREIEIGETFQGKVKRILDFGAFVEILPGQEGLVHISQLASFHVKKVEDIVKIGDIVPVKVISIDDQGRINLSIKEARETGK